MPSKASCPSIFTCQMCGECCRGYGGTYVSESDIKAIANFIGEDPEHFKTRYCQLSGSRYVLAQAESGYCVFWDELCRIHPVKPRMCRNWPYISAVLEDVANWRMMANSCPGIKTDVSDEVIRRTVARKIEERRRQRRQDAESADPEPEG